MCTGCKQKPNFGDDRTRLQTKLKLPFLHPVDDTLDVEYY